MAIESQDSAWPLPKFYFSVKFGSQGSTVTFQEILGLESETQVIEYRHSNNPLFSTITMPDITKMARVTLKKGIFVKDNNFWKWYNDIQMNTVKREKLVIQLLDETAKTIMTWTLTNAWPIKITGTDLNSDANEVAIETLELAYEGLSISNGE
jgi:phage tail-like protein